MGAVDHGVQYNQQEIREVERILKKNLTARIDEANACCCFFGDVDSAGRQRGAVDFD